MASPFNYNPSSLGTDIAWDGDLDPSFSLVSGTRNMQLHVMRRFMTDRGRLFYERGYGYNLEQYINADVDRKLLQQIQIDIQKELLSDERILSCDVNVEWLPESSRIRIKSKCYTQEGSFDNVITIDSVGVGFEGV